MHPNERDDAMRRDAREGKATFVVRLVTTTTYRVWAEDSAKAEDAAYWQRSSGRPAPDVEPLGTTSRWEVGA